MQVRGRHLGSDHRVLAIIVTGIETSQEPLRYLPVFALGMIMYVRRGWLATAAGALDRFRPAAWIVTSVAAVLFLTAPWTASNVHGLPVQAVWVLHGLQIVGAMVAVFVASSCQGARKVLAGPVVLWLGTRSFSLYLIHEPIVVAVGYAQGGSGPVWATFGISLALALGLTEVFFRAVEKPSHQLAKRLGALVDGRQRQAKTKRSVESTPAS